jgi:predicted ATP-dependent protease
MVNEKIEGFYDVCKVIGLTGQQGVCIPASNVQNLVLRDDVRQAISEDVFHIYPIETVDQGLELLSGIKAGALNEPKTLHWYINKRLDEMAQSLRHFGTSSKIIETRPTGQVSQPGPPKTPGDQP